MPDWTSLATMLPSVVAGLKGSGAETAAFMEGYNRTTDMLKQRQLQQQSIDEAGRRTDLAGAEQTYQHGQDALRNRTSALDTLLGALPGLASEAGPSVTGTTSMETPIGSIGVPTVQGPEAGMMAQVQSLADLLGQSDVAPALAPMVRPALSRAEAARANQRRRAYADAIELADKRSGVSSEAQVQAGTLITVTLPNGATERIPYAEALRVSGMPPVKASKAPVAAGSFEDYVPRFAQEIGKTVDTLTAGDMELARKRYQQADDRPPAAVYINQARSSDIEEMASGLADGTVAPSQLSKRAATYDATLAKARRMYREKTGQPLDLTRLENDYQGARRFVSNMNGPQMIRFKALATSVVNTIDEVQRLADELKQGGVQAFNRAKRATILSVYGNTPQSDTAARYIGAVNTLKEEFANLAQGGYAPTEAAWSLANGQINQDFGVKDLSASLSEVQRLINYRINAFDEVAPYKTGGTMQEKPASGVTILKIEKVK